MLMMQCMSTDTVNMVVMCVVSFFLHEKDQVLTLFVPFSLSEYILLHFIVLHCIKSTQCVTSTKQK